MQSGNRRITAGCAGRTVRPGATRTRLGYPVAMGFSEADLELIDRTEEIRIGTSIDGADVHRTIIWAVVDDGTVFVRSYVGASARWYREAIANPDVTIHVGDRSLPARATLAADPDSIDRTSRALVRKYSDDPATPRMNRPEVLDLTLRLDPR